MLVVEFKLYDRQTKKYSQTLEREFADITRYEAYVLKMLYTCGQLVLPIKIVWG